ncbi:7722_t:CDS:1, partial [Gigaspora margarita]
KYKQKETLKIKEKTNNSTSISALLGQRAVYSLHKCIIYGSWIILSQLDDTGKEYPAEYA